MGGLARIDRAFHRAREEGRAALIPFVTAGDPDPATTAALVPALAASGADLVELGVPYSDPLADGPVIQRASERALRQGVTLAGVLDIIHAIRNTNDILPIILMTYVNPILDFGVERLADEATAAGADGFLVSDLPAEEESLVRPAMAARGLATVFLAAPTSGPERLARIAEVSSGFVYCVSRTGVTGERRELSGRVRDTVARLREMTEIPVGVGFGISTAEQVGAVASYADAAIVGSALVSRMAAARAGGAVAAGEAFVRELAAGTRRG